MIGQKLLNTNINVTVAESKKIRKLNKAVEQNPNLARHSWSDPSALFCLFLVPSNPLSLLVVNSFVC